MYTTSRTVTYVITDQQPKFCPTVGTVLSNFYTYQVSCFASGATSSTLWSCVGVVSLLHLKPLKVHPDVTIPRHAAGAAESISIKAVQDVAQAPSNDPLTSAITSDIQTDLQADGQPQPQPPPRAVAVHVVQPNDSCQLDTPTAGRTSSCKGLSGNQSPLAAESISPRYSSQQSQDTNIDWEEATQQGEISSRASHADAKASHSNTLAAQPGTIEHHIANQHIDQYSDFLGQAYQGHDPAKRSDPKPAPPSLPQKPTSQSSQRARAMADAVKGMAPNPGCTMVGEEGGGRPWLKRAFSMVDQENMGIDMGMDMDSLDKVASQCLQCKSTLCYHCIIAC